MENMYQLQEPLDIKLKLITGKTISVTAAVMSPRVITALSGEDDIPTYLRVSSDGDLQVVSEKTVTDFVYHEVLEGWYPAKTTITSNVDLDLGDYRLISDKASRKEAAARITEFLEIDDPNFFKNPVFKVLKRRAEKYTLLQNLESDVAKLKSQETIDDADSQRLEALDNSISSTKEELLNIDTQLLGSNWSIDYEG